MGAAARRGSGDAGCAEPAPAVAAGRQGVAGDRRHPAAAGVAGSCAGDPGTALCRRRHPAHRHVHRLRGAGGGLVEGDRRRGAAEPGVHRPRSRMILLGALAPFCSCEVIPFISALLAVGAPLSAVMAFWLASPLMDSGDVPDHRRHAGHRVRGGEDGGGGGAGPGRRHAGEGACRQQSVCRSAQGAIA